MMADWLKGLFMRLGIIFLAFFTFLAVVPVNDAPARPRPRRIIVVRPPLRPGKIIKVLPPARKVIVFRDKRYFFHNGVFYKRVPGGFVVVKPPVGIIIVRPRVRFKTIWIGGVLYYYYGGIFYRRVPGGFIVVAPPPGVVIAEEPPTLVQPEETASGEVSVTVARLNVRSGPGLNYPVIDQVEANTRLKVKGKSPGWFFVELPDGKLGWVMKKYTMTITPPAKG